MSNVLYIPSTEKNLIPPFLMREAGLLVNDVAIIQCVEYASYESHSIIFQ